MRNPVSRASASEHPSGRISDRIPGVSSPGSLYFSFPFSDEFTEQHNPSTIISVGEVGAAELAAGHRAAKVRAVSAPHLAKPTIKPRCYSGRGGGFYP